MERLEVLKDEINYIKDDRVKESLIYMINKLPDYFFTVEAASTGKYHPSYAQGEGGLLRHSKAAMRIGYELLSKKYDSIEDKLLFQCPKGHVFEMRYNDFKNNGQRCPKCKESKGEREVARVLDKMHIDYERQYKFENCKYKRCLPFDFYIPSLNVCIEYDGEYHYEVRQGTEDDLKQRHIWDETKNVYCEQNNIRLIRIHYWEFNNIEQILKDILE